MQTKLKTGIFGYNSLEKILSHKFTLIISVTVLENPAFTSQNGIFCTGFNDGLHSFIEVLQRQITLIT